jgi:hypothetical protein
LKLSSSASIQNSSSVLIIEELENTFDPAILFVSGASEERILFFPVVHLPYEFLFGSFGLDLIDALRRDVAADAA